MVVTRTTKQPSLWQLVVHPTAGGVRSPGSLYGTAWIFLSTVILPVCPPLVSPLEMYQKKGGGGVHSLCWGRGRGGIGSSSCLQTVGVWVKFANERIGTFHKTECDNDIIWYEHLRDLSYGKYIISILPSPSLSLSLSLSHTHTHCFYEHQLIHANSFRHISTKLLFHLIAGEFSITRLSLADFLHYLYIFFIFTNSEVGMWYYLLFVRLKFIFHWKRFLILAAPRNLGETSLTADKILYKNYWKGTGWK
jgi:hypothetical protein